MYNSHVNCTIFFPEFTFYKGRRVQDIIVDITFPIEFSKFIPLQYLSISAGMLSSPGALHPSIYSKMGAVP